ncbi:MAG TPA: galactose-1-epimerase, partial [Cyclobacteriaceae bacterium]|nr:galactose-1-epimerase [Cyclobacteriaceae bacterium]
ADHYTPVDDGLIPTGEIKEVKDSPFDFTSPHKIGERIDKVPGGYDHNFVLNRTDSTLMLAAVVIDSLSGRKIETLTTEPGVQFYSGNFLDGTLISSNGIPFKKHSGMCLETQHFPDSPNRSSFPSTLLRPGEKYKTTTVYRFSVE